MDLLTSSLFVLISTICTPIGFLIGKKTKQEIENRTKLLFLTQILLIIALNTIVLVELCIQGEMLSLFGFFAGVLLMIFLPFNIELYESFKGAVLGGSFFLVTGIETTILVSTMNLFQGSLISLEKKDKKTKLLAETLIFFFASAIIIGLFYITTIEIKGFIFGILGGSLTVMLLKRLWK